MTLDEQIAEAEAEFNRLGRLERAALIKKVEAHQQLEEIFLLPLR